MPSVRKARRISDILPDSSSSSESDLDEDDFVLHTSSDDDDNDDENPFDEDDDDDDSLGNSIVHDDILDAMDTQPVALSKETCNLETNNSNQNTCPDSLAQPLDPNNRSDMAVREKSAQSLTIKTKIPKKSKSEASISKSSLQLKRTKSTDQQQKKNSPNKKSKSSEKCTSTAMNIEKKSNNETANTTQSQSKPKKRKAKTHVTSSTNINLLRQDNFEKTSITSSITASSKSLSSQLPSQSQDTYIVVGDDSISQNLTKAVSPEPKNQQLKSPTSSIKSSKSITTSTKRRRVSTSPSSKPALEAVTPTPKSTSKAQMDNIVHHKTPNTKKSSKIMNELENVVPVTPSTTPKELKSKVNKAKSAKAKKEAKSHKPVTATTTIPPPCSTKAQPKNKKSKTKASQTPSNEKKHNKNDSSKKNPPETQTQTVAKNKKEQQKPVPKAPPKKKKRNLQDQVLHEMLMSGKPYNLKTLSQSTKIPDQALHSILLSLLDKQLVFQREFSSKSRVKILYWANQDSQAKDALKAKATTEEIEEVKHKLVELSKFHRHIGGQLQTVKAHPTNLELDRQIEMAEKGILDFHKAKSAICQRIDERKNSKNVKLRDMSPKSLKSKINKFRLLWKKRKELCMDFADKIAEAMEKKLKDAIKVLDIETDEAEGVKMPLKYIIDS